jgi:tetratricopeptide (TPR) repeat protein
MAIKPVTDSNHMVSTLICVKAFRYKPAVSLVLIVSVLALLATAPRAQVPQLGTVDFPTSGTPQAQEHFLRGVAALHSLRWGDAAQLLSSLPVPTGKGTAPTGANPYQAFAAFVQTPALFARGLAAAMQGAPEAQQQMAALRARRGQSSGTAGSFGVNMDTVLELQALEIAAVASAAQGHLDEAMSTMQQATTLEDTIPPPPGPPPMIKPAHELFGEILLRAHRPDDAVPQFATALYRHPSRAQAMLGAARAAARRGDRDGAVRAYTQFRQQWQHGDQQLPAFQEAQAYLQKAGALQQVGVR